VLVLSLTAACTATVRAQNQSLSGPADRAAEASITETPIKDYKVENVTMTEALLKLRDCDLRQVLIGFEAVPHREGEKGRSISLKVDAGTLGEVVRHLCEADPRYEYAVVQGPIGHTDLKGSMMEIRPKGALKDRTDLLNMRVRDYEIDSNITAGEAILHINQDAPELQEFLHRKAEGWRQRKGIPPGPEIGAIMHGNMIPPRFTLRLHDVTVRQILDVISLKSIDVYEQQPEVNAQGMRGKPYPTGWRYDFVIKPAASTGIGGIPEWQYF